MPPLPIVIFAAGLALVAVYAVCVLAKDAAVIFLLAIGYLPRERNMFYTASGHPRSGKWRTFERDLIKARGGVCEACGGSENPEGHHIEDFHAHPEKELDPDNVAILCGPQGRNCHLRLGHSFDYRAINPRAKEDAARQRYRIKTRLYE
jgi:hypothetical protein